MSSHQAAVERDYMGKGIKQRGNRLDFLNKVETDLP